MILFMWSRRLVISNAPSRTATAVTHEAATLTAIGNHGHLAACQTDAGNRDDDQNLPYDPVNRSGAAFGNFGHRHIVRHDRDDPRDETEQQNRANQALIGRADTVLPDNGCCHHCAKGSVVVIDVSAEDVRFVINVAPPGCRQGSGTELSCSGQDRPADSDSWIGQSQAAPRAPAPHCPAGRRVG